MSDRDDHQYGFVAVEQTFYEQPNPDVQTWPRTFSYVLALGGEDTDFARGLLAENIQTLANVNISMDEVQLGTFVSMVIDDAVDAGLSVAVLPPDPLIETRIVGYETGGVDILLGSPTPWDPTMFCLRFGWKPEI